MKEIKFFEWQGLNIPYVPSDTYIQVTPDGDEKMEILPPHVQSLKNGNVDAALIQICKEKLIDAVSQISFDHIGYTAPINVSGSIPYGSIYVDRKWERIIVNEEWATARAVDSDGDAGAVLYGFEEIDGKYLTLDDLISIMPENALENMPEGANPIRYLLKSHSKQATLVKYPITQTPSNLTIEKKRPYDKMESFTKADFEAVLEEHPFKTYEPEVIFRKQHEHTEVGLKTSAWNNYELWQNRGKSRYDVLENMFHNILRYKDIEENGLKKARSGAHNDTNEDYKSPKDFFNFKLTDTLSWMFCSCNNIGGMREKQVDWAGKVDIFSHLDKILQMNISDSWFRQTNFNPQLPPKKVRVVDGYIDHLIKIGVLNFIEIPSSDPEMPPAVIIMIMRNGELVALTDTKREVHEQSYGYVLYPVWSDKAQKFCHPIDYLRHVSGYWDFVIINRQDGSQGIFPSYQEQLGWYPVKTALLQNALIEHCDKFGDMVPFKRTKEGLKPEAHSLKIASMTVVIPYNDCPVEQMYEIAQRANKVRRLCLAGGKGKDHDSRKYLFAREDGSAICQPKGCDEKRGGAQRAQLVRASGSDIFRIMIVKQCSKQVKIFKSGIEKQSKFTSFMAQLSKEPVEGWTETRHTTLSGEERKVWVTDPQTQIEVGKLIDSIGNKFMPLPENDIVYSMKDGLPIDLAIPIDEIISKNCQHYLFSIAEEQTISVNGEEIQAMVYEFRMFRTGSASENVPGRMRKVSYKGIDGMEIQHQFSKIYPYESKERDPMYNNMLTEAYKVLSKTQ